MTHPSEPDTQRRRRGIQLVLGLGLGVVCLALLLRGVPLAEVRAQIVGADWWYVAPVAGLFLVDQGIRALRQWLLVRPLAPGCGFGNQLAILCTTTFFVNTLPVRLGEAVRPVLLKQREGVDLGAGFGMVVVERALDAVGLLGALLAVLVIVDLPPAPIELAGRWIDPVALGRTLALLGVVPGLVLLVGAAIFGNRALDAVRRPLLAGVRRLGPGWLERGTVRILDFAVDFVGGLASVKDPLRLAAALGLTAASFVNAGCMAALLARAVGLEDFIGMLEGIGVQAVALSSLLLPAPPGYIGVFEAAVVAGLALFGVRGQALAAPALGFALLLHWICYPIQAVLTLLALWWGGLRPGAALSTSAAAAGTRR